MKKIGLFALMTCAVFSSSGGFAGFVEDACQAYDRARDSSTKKNIEGQFKDQCSDEQKKFECQGNTQKAMEYYFMSQLGLRSEFPREVVLKSEIQNFGRSNYRRATILRYFRDKKDGKDVFHNTPAAYYATFQEGQGFYSAYLASQHPQSQTGGWSGAFAAASTNMSEEEQVQLAMAISLEETKDQAGGWGASAPAVSLDEDEPKPVFSSDYRRRPAAKVSRDEATGKDEDRSNSPVSSGREDKFPQELLDIAQSYQGAASDAKREALGLKFREFCYAEQYDCFNKANNQFYGPSQRQSFSDKSSEWANLLEGDVEGFIKNHFQSATGFSAADTDERDVAPKTRTPGQETREICADYEKAIFDAERAALNQEFRDFCEKKSKSFKAQGNDRGAKEYAWMRYYGLTGVYKNAEYFEDLETYLKLNRREVDGGVSYMGPAEVLAGVEEPPQGICP